MKLDRDMTKEEFSAWRDHPGTQHLLAILAHRRELLRRTWEGGGFADYEKDATVLVNVGNLGTCKGYAFTQELTYEDYQSEMSDVREREWN